MPPPVNLNEFTLIIIVVLMIMGGTVIGWILHALHVAGRQVPPQERTPWIALFGGCIAIYVLTTPSSSSNYISPADRVVIRPAPPNTRLTIDTTDCGPRAPGYTDQLVFTVESRADLDPVVTGCTRIAERSFGTDTRP